MKNNLIFRPIHFKVRFSPANKELEGSTVPYACSYVYSGENYSVTYVIERIEQSYYLTKWADVPARETGTKKDCEYAIRKDLHEMRLNPELNRNADFYRDIYDRWFYEKLTSDQRSSVTVGQGIDIENIGIVDNRYGVVYGNINADYDRQLLFKLEKSGRKWSYGHWERNVGTKYETLKECRYAARNDLLIS